MTVLTSPGGADLLPADFLIRYNQVAASIGGSLESAEENPHLMRVMCDFVSGMTDRYAAEFFCRIRSENYQSIFRDY
jgi:dGTPase